MKAFLIAAATIFGLITIAHIWRILLENHALARDPGFILLTILSAGLCVWALQLLRRPSKR